MRRYLLLFTIVTVVTCASCPGGDTPNQCNQCSGLQKCFTIDRQRELKICCDTWFCKDTGLESYLWGNGVYGFTTELYAGIWENRTVGSMTAACPIPFSSLLDIDYKRFINTTEVIDALPLVEKYPFNKKGEQWKPGGTVKVDPCSTNKDCSHLTTRGVTVGYCYNSRNPSFFFTDSLDKIKFCYKLTELNNSNYFIEPDAVGPQFCDENVDCRSPHYQGISYDAWYCHKTNLYHRSSTKNRTGICIRTRSCVDSSFAVRPENGNNCDPTSKTSCNFKGPPSFPAMPWTIAPKNYTSVCVNISLNAQDNFMCCQEQIKKCVTGKIIKPYEFCTKTPDCNNKSIDFSVFDSYKNWCDPVDQICCDPENDTSLVYCPDDATPLRFEKECDGGYETGTCSNDYLEKNVTTSGVCKFGHCCPELEVVNNQVIIGKHSFATHHPCINGTVPARFKYAYCDRKTDNVVVIGELNLQGDVLKQSLMKCKNNENCCADNVCVLENDGVKHCYEVLPKPQHSQWSRAATILVSLLIGAILCICFCGGLLICMWCLCVPISDQRNIRKSFKPIDWILVFLHLRKTPDGSLNNKARKSKNPNKESASKEDAKRSKETPSKENTKKSKETPSKENTKKSNEMLSKETTKRSKEVLSREKTKKIKEIPSKENTKSKERLSKEDGR